MNTDIRRLLATVTAAAFVLGPAAPARATPAPPVSSALRAVEAVRPAVVLVRADWTVRVRGEARGRRVASVVGFTTVCSGLIVGSAGHIVTAGHCVRADDNRDTAITAAVDDLAGQGVIRASRRDGVLADALTGPDRWKLSDVHPAVQIQFGGGSATWTPVRDPGAGVDAQVVEALSWRKGDVALLKVDGTGLPVATLARPGEVLVGQRVLAVGYPFTSPAGGAVLAVAGRDGLVDAVDTGGVRGPGKQFYRTGADLTPGLTGGAVIDLQGQVVGTASLRVRDGAGFIVPAAVIGEMLARHGVQNQRGPIDTVYAAGLDAFYRGDFQRAIKDFDRVLAAMPGHHAAAEKRRQAADHPDEPGGPERARLIAAGVVVLAVIVLGVLLLRQLAGARRSRMAEPVSPAPSRMDDRTEIIPVVRDDWADPVVGRVTVAVRPRCRRCGRAHEVDAAYCPSCGRRLEEQPADADGRRGK